MKLGIVGLPNVGKSTLFNALTNAGAESANYPFCTIEPNVGVVTVPDARLDYLAEMYQPKKYTPATIEFVDIAGLVKGASQGEGLGNKFLGDIRNTDAIVHVVRCFDNADIIRHECSHDPVSDIETVDLELILADIEMLRRRQDKAEKNAKSGDKKFKKEAEVLGRLIEWMDGGRSARSFEADEEEREIIAASDLLTNKPIIYAANLGEDGFSAGAENNAYYRQVKALADAEGSRVLPVCARFEQEIAELDEEERAVFMEELGMTESGLQRLALVRAGEIDDHRRAAAQGAARAGVEIVGGRGIADVEVEMRMRVDEAGEKQLALHRDDLGPVSYTHLTLPTSLRV